MSPQSIRIILVSPSHPGNIGSAARAMKLMGLSDLVLVNPKRFPDPQATAMATGGKDILERATVVKSLAEALTGCTRVYATSARGRSLSLPTRSAREAAVEVAADASHQVAFVFGRECSGLTNDELMLANRTVMIPTAPDFRSLNLSQAVQIISYELFVASQGSDDKQIKESMQSEPLASMEQLAGLYDHYNSALTKIEFLKPNQSATLMNRLKRLYSRCELTVNELNILRGILSDTERQVALRLASEKNG